MRVVVTGASSGIGRAFCELILSSRTEAKVLGVGRNEAKLNELKLKYGGRFDYVVADLSIIGEIRRVVDEVKRCLGSVDVLVNNAGFGTYKDVLNHSDDDVLGLVGVNFVAPYVLVRDLVGCMGRGSVIVNVLTAGIYVLMVELSMYGASKLALYYVTEVLRRRLKDRGITVVSVFPGVVSTEFHRRAGLRGISGGVPAEVVARAILKAVEERREEVFIPKYLKVLKVVGPKLIPWYGFKLSKTQHHD